MAERVVPPTSVHVSRVAPLLGQQSCQQVLHVSPRLTSQTSFPQASVGATVSAVVGLGVGESVGLNVGLVVGASVGGVEITVGVAVGVAVSGALILPYEAGMTSWVCPGYSHATARLSPPPPSFILASKK